ncbi:transmembrane protein 43-like isoform X1 [Branchiostoma floridae x Branchiostoma belcheri]
MYRQTYPDAPGMHTSGPDSHTRVTYREQPGFLSRLKNSFFGAFFGFLLFCGAFPVLFWNEGRAVQTAQSLDEGLRSVIHLSTVDVAFEHNNHKLVYFTGPLSTNKPLTDTDYAVTVPAVKLKKHVEMYQWVEHEHTKEYKEGNQVRRETTYTYNNEWRSDLVNSRNFDREMGHKNPGSMPVRSETITADDVTIGNFHLSKGLIGKISHFVKYPLAKSHLVPSDPQVKVFQGAFYHSADPIRPKVGDVRVEFSYAGLSGNSELGPADHVSIVARQAGNRLQPYQTEAGDALELLYYGVLSPEKIFEAEHAANTMLTWAVRAAGWFMMFVALFLMTNILQTLVDWIPLVREVLSLGLFIVNLSVSLSLSLITIALGWIRYRPLVGLTLLACAAVPWVLSRQRVRARKEKDDKTDNILFNNLDQKAYYSK